MKDLEFNHAVIMPATDSSKIYNIDTPILLSAETKTAGFMSSFEGISQTELEYAI
jgi:hypothetical protein